jgi:aquaporin Z
MRRALQQHWPEYVIEGALLALFMVSACTFGVLLFHPSSPVIDHLPNALIQRMLMGLAMGATAVGLIYSPWGKRSGAHFNPAVTLTFYRLGRIAPWDAAFYALAQFVGGICGVMMSQMALGTLIQHPSVNYVVTGPGEYGVEVAFAAEAGITFVLMSVILRVSNHRRFAQFTGVCAGLLVAMFITFESPISGMSMNPARSFASAFAAYSWMAQWIYFVAPPLGMLAAAQVYLMTHGGARIGCAKLHHSERHRCIFCAFHQARKTIPPGQVGVVAAK